MIRERWQQISLRGKIAGLMSLLVLMTVGALTYLSIQRERLNFQQELVSQAGLLLETLSLTLRDPLYLVELDELIDAAKVISRSPDVSMFVTFDAEGKTLVHSQQPELTFSQTVDPLGHSLVSSEQESNGMDWQKEQLIAGRAVLLGGQPIGAIAIGLSTQPLEQKITTITRKASCWP